MSTDEQPIGLDRDAMIRLIAETWPDAVVATIESAAFFSPLLTEAHDRLAAAQSRQRTATAGE